MPAIACNPPVVVWDMPFATAGTTAPYRDRAKLHADATNKAAREGAEAFRRFRGNAVGTADPQILYLKSCMLDPLTARDSLRRLAASQGIDLNGLIAQAARHFGSPVIERRTEPLSREELEFLFDDDQRALNS